MIRRYGETESALTGLELVIMVAVFTGIAALLILYAGGGDTAGKARAFPTGVVADSMYISGDNLQPVGNLFGFPAVNNPAATPPVVMAREDPGRLGAIRLVVSLFIGDTGAIDMDRVRVQWDDTTGYRTVSRSTSSALICPNWTISDKFNMLPGRTADADNLLEPGEQFEITLCPAEGVPPYGTFTIVISPDGPATPLKVRRTVPAVIAPVMNLG